MESLPYAKKTDKMGGHPKNIGRTTQIQRIWEGRLPEILRTSLSDKNDAVQTDFFDQIQRNSEYMAFSDILEHRWFVVKSTENRATVTNCVNFITKPSTQITILLF